MTSHNTKLVSLRCLLFFFFAGLGCLYPYLPLHMNFLGLTRDEVHVVSIVSPLVAGLGPLLVCPLADRLGGPQGRSLRLLLTGVMLLMTVAYSLLACLPSVQRVAARQPAVNFSCEPSGAAILQERCMEPACYEWPQHNLGPLVLSNCHYECQTETAQLDVDKITTVRSNEAEESTVATVTDAGIGDDLLEVVLSSSEDEAVENEEENRARKRRDIIPLTENTPPHLCSVDDADKKTCYVYTPDTASITINASLLKATNGDSDNDEWCRHPLAGNLSCRIPAKLIGTGRYSACQVVCSLPEPYSSQSGVLAQSQCKTMIGDAGVTFWSYLVVRSVADVFCSASVALLNAAVVIATREIDLADGDVGHEFVWGLLGFAVISPIVGTLNSFYLAIPPSYFVAFIAFVVLMAVSVLILAFAHSMPLYRPEWWPRHTRVVPLGGLRSHACELAALSFILVLLGAFWSVLDCFFPWHLYQARTSEFILGLTLTVGSLPAIPFLWYAKKVVHYCGYSNLLITAFTMYIIRYTVLSFLEDPWWVLACEALEVFTLSLMWVTAVLYVCHLMPRHLSVTAQGMVVLCHFCLGRCLGAVVVTVVSSYDSAGIGTTTAMEVEKMEVEVMVDRSLYLVQVYQAGAVAAAVVAAVYFCVYHCCLKACCHRSTRTGVGNPSGITQGPTTNGTYTPLRVYHNGSGRKGQIH